MHKIIPYLWFDDRAEEAVTFYMAAFEKSRIGEITRYDEASAQVSGKPQGSAMTIAFELAGQEFVALNGGPVFKFTPAISFFVNCETEAEIHALWETLSTGGEILMPMDQYPFSQAFGWTNDRFGVSWQLNLTGRAHTPKITPFLMFVGQQQGKAEEAAKFYTSLFDHSDMVHIERFGAGEGGAEGTVKHARFVLDGEEFIAMDGGTDHAFTFTEAISFLVNCKTQEEVDDLWDRLTQGGEEEPCGWLKDQYGVSWQIIPTTLMELLHDPDPEKSQRVVKAMLQMKKIDIQTLKEAAAQ